MLTSGPRIFISYARKDGEAIASDLRQRLEDDHRLSVWQDLTKMQGGHGWWEQIREAIKAVEFLILVMTPQALRSPVVRREWRLARQGGTCVVPIKGTPDVDIESLPKWMNIIHFVDPERPEQWKQFIETLQAPCDARRVPFMAQDLPEDYVARPNELAPMIDGLLDREREEAVAITTALEGAGGFGKTVLAQAVCHDERIQEAFFDGILWVTLGEKPRDLIGLVADLIETLEGKRPGFENLEKATTKLIEVLQDRTALVVIDDVWNEAHLKPFLQGGPNCARLITTRDRTTVPADAQQILVDAMRTAEAKQLLGAGLPKSDVGGFETLVKRLGEWPLLVKLVNGVLRSRVVGAKQPLSKVLDYVNQALDAKGLTYFDARNAEERWQAVNKTISVSLDLLTEEEQSRFSELAVFPEDAEVPMQAVEALWSATGGLGTFETEDLCRVLFERSLLLGFDLLTRRIRLHDVVRQYLLDTQGDDEKALHQTLIRAYDRQCSDGWASGPDDGYFFQFLLYHLKEAGEEEQLRALLLDYDWLLAKLRATNARALLGDCDLLADDPEIRLLQAAIRHSTSALTRDPGQLAVHLVGRFLSFEEAGLHGLCERARLRGPGSPWFCPKTLSLRPPGGLLTQTFAGHPGSVEGAAVSADGRRALSWSEDETLRLWDLETGAALHTLDGHMDEVRGATVLADGRQALSWSKDRTLRLWDLEAGAALRTLEGHTGSVEGATVLADGRRALSWPGGWESKDHTLRLWDLEAGAALHTLEGHTGPVEGATVLADGRRALSWSRDETLRLWDLEAGAARHTLEGHTDWVWGATVLADGRRALSWSEDETLRLWDLEAGAALHTLEGHTGRVSGATVLADGRRALSWSYDGTLRLWDLEAGAALHTLDGHTGSVRGATVLADGRRALSWSYDGTLRLWDLEAGAARHTFEGHTLAVLGATVLADGRRALSWSEDGTLRLWDLEAGAARHTLEGHTGWVSGATVLADGRRALSWSEDGTLRLWDLEAVAALHTREGHTVGVSGATVLADGRRALSWSRDGTLRLWDLEAGATLHILKGHTSWVEGATVLADGRRALSWSEDETLRLWDLEAGTALHTLEGHTDWVLGATVLADGRRALSWSYDGTLRLWDLEAGVALHTLDGHTGEVLGATVLADGRRALSWSRDETLRLWDLEAGAALHTLEGHTGSVEGAKVLADGRRALSWSGGWESKDHTLRLWDLEAGAALHTLEGHTGSVEGATVLADGRRALSWSRDETLRLWDLEAGAALHTLEGHTGQVLGATVLAGGRRALSWSCDGTLRLWDLEAGAALHTFEGQTDEVRGATVLADGRRALSWSWDGALILWELKTADMIARFIGDASIDPVIEAREDLFVAGSDNGAVHILELRHG